MRRINTKLLHLAIIIAFMTIFSMLFLTHDTFALSTEFYSNITSFPISRTITSSWCLEEMANPINNTFTYSISTPNTAPLNPSGAIREPTSAQIVFNQVTPSYPALGSCLRATATA